MNNLKRYRIINELTQLELSVKSGVSQQLISYFEINGVRHISSLVEQLAQALDVEINDLLDHKNGS